MILVDIFDNGSKVVIYENDSGSFFGDFSIGDIYGKVDISYFESWGIVGIVVSDSNCFIEIF